MKAKSYRACLPASKASAEMLSMALPSECAECHVKIIYDPKFPAPEDAVMVCIDCMPAVAVRECSLVVLPSDEEVRKSAERMKSRRN